MTRWAFRRPGKPKELPGRVRHGSARAYNYYRCRCLECGEWRRYYDRERWALLHRGKEPK